ncbi:MAG TPA: hypothetical protein P5287_03280 [bacterium]|nr:hypothetical protein [bacterium]
MRLALVIAAAAVCAAGIARAEETRDELSAIDDEIAAEERLVIGAAQGVPPGTEQTVSPRSLDEIGGAASGSLPGASETQEAGGWVKRDMGGILEKIDTLSEKKKEGRRFQFDRDDLDTTRTGKPELTGR